MPRYKIQAPDGRTITIEGETPPQEADLDALFSYVDKEPSFQPGYFKTEKEIASREAPFDNPMREPTMAEKIFPPLRGFAAASPLIRRGEAAIANPAMAIQRGEFNPQTLASEVGKGLKGERLGEIGDVARQVGVPSPIAAAMGMAGLSGVIKAGASTLGGVKKLQDAARYAGQTRRTRKYGKVANSIDEAMSEARTKTGKPIGEFIDQNENVPLKIPAEDWSNLLGKLPPIVRKELGIDAGYMPQATMGMAQKIRRLLSGKVSGKYFDARAVQPELKPAIDFVHGELSNLQTATSPALKGLRAPYSEVMKSRGRILPKIKTKEGFTDTKGVAGIFKKGSQGDLPSQQALKQLEKYSPEISKQTRKLIKMRKWDDAKGLLSKYGVPTALISSIVWGANKISGKDSTPDYGGGTN